MRVDIHDLSISLDERVLDSALAERVVGSDDGDALRSTGMGHGDPVDTMERERFIVSWFFAN